MRRRRKKSDRMCVDAIATAAMCFEDRDSFVHTSGRHFYYGVDAAKARETAYAEWAESGRICAVCKQRVRGEPDWHHVIPKGSHGVNRDDHPRNRAFVHSMFDAEPCHRSEHNREPKWTPREERIA